VKGLGQLVISGISGTVLTPDEEEFLEKEDIGGVILFAHNYESPEQLAELVNSIQRLRNEYPLFITVDHEGGRVIRFKEHFTQFPSMHDMGRLDSPKLVFEAHEIMAKELKACGVNVNFSPCCDIWTNAENKVIGDRSFGDSVDLVDKMISASIRGLQTNGILACAKHFPGHGDTVKDSHFDLPVLKMSLDELEQRELLPFVRAAKSRVEFMMMAHLIVECLDPELPTSLSTKAYDYLRQKTKFKHIIVTDDMEMKAIADRYGVEEAAAMAISAGADIVEYRSMEMARKALEGLKEAYRTKKIKASDVQEKLSRIMDVKKRYFSEYNPLYIPDVKKEVGVAESKQFLKMITDRLSTCS